MRAAEHECLDDQPDADPEFAVAEPVADQRGTRERHGAKQGLLPEAGVQRGRHRRQPWHRAGQDVGIDERFGRRPPVPQLRGDGVEADDVAELDARQQRAAERPADDRAAAGRVARPHAPQLGVVRERAASEPFGGQ